MFSYSLAQQLWDFYWILIGWFIKLSVWTFQPLFLIYISSNFCKNLSSIVLYLISLDKLTIRIIQLNLDVLFWHMYNYNIFINNQYVFIGYTKERVRGLYKQFLVHFFYPFTMVATWAIKIQIFFRNCLKTNARIFVKTINLIWQKRKINAHLKFQDNGHAIKGVWFYAIVWTLLP